MVQKLKEWLKKPISTKSKTTNGLAVLIGIGVVLATAVVRYFTKKRKK